MIEQKTMFGVAAIGVSVVVGYGLYKYVQGRQKARKIKEAVDEMIKNIDKPNVYMRDSVHVREKLKVLYEGGSEKLQVISDFDKTLTKFNINGEKGCTVYGVIESCKLFPESYREKAKELKEKYMPIEFSGDISSDEKLPHMIEWWTKGNELITELKLQQTQIPDIVKDAHIALRDGVEWFFVKLHEKKVPVLIISGGLGDIIKEVIDQQSTLYDNVNIVANFFKYEQGVMVGFKDKLLFSHNKKELTKDLPYFDKVKDRTGVIVMGDLPEDAHVSASPKNSEVTLTVGFLNDKVDERVHDYMDAFDIVIVDDHSIELVDLLLMTIIRAK
ncbi:cytosolic 5'-nucleotidase 3-like isoform X1 [Orbicella faveolata]|uniref:cytosolic 5'-nucleotidase 3-like isoform X1 n=1 Tax=Orbicella faveolata TaxID=48498 RepID=UPI0009E22FA7|nr:cytosolic 5'-nucleotidase 3-like isoform X1 [Orbicella faveolata]XP_020614948.1 cytosolic 5'-nucleotidase 3-like isoform X1 [Orbicella faveolata]